MNPWKRKEVIGNATLYLGDCLEILPTLPKVDALITDPPYGLAERLDGGSGEWNKLYGDGAPSWDTETVPLVNTLPALAGSAIIWGGNYYDLPPARGWLIWDKMQDHSSGHAEMAWTNINIPIRTFRYARAQLASEGKVHPTQKPLPLMRWCLSFVLRAQTILDPFMGSGSTGAACAQMGRSFIGIDLDPKYFDIACERIANAQRQRPLFAPDVIAEQDEILFV